MSFHHYPDPQAFFDSVKRCLRPNGRLILRDVTSDNKVLVWLMNTLEMPLANICGHGDVRVPTRNVVMKCCRKVGLKVENPQRYEDALCCQKSLKETGYEIL